MSDTTIWITGATSGIGKALSLNVPYAGARIINLSRRKHPDFESVIFDLTEPSTWGAVRSHLHKELSNFKGERAIFIQNACWMAGNGTIESLTEEDYQKALYANVMAPLAIGEMFVRNCRPGYEAGIAMMSAGAAACCLEGLSAYGPGKIAIEHWAQNVDKELGTKPGRPWVCAVRPGGTRTATVQRIADTLDPSMPNAQHIRDNIMRRLDPTSAAKQIWGQLPPKPGISLISFGEPPEDPQYRFEDQRKKSVNVPGWQLMYR